MAAHFVKQARALVEQGKHEEAIQVSRRGLKQNPSEVEGRLVLAAALMATAQFDDVLTEMASALKADPGNPSAMTLTGEALLNQGAHERSLEILGRAAAQSPNDPYVERLRHRARTALGLAVSSETLEIDPDVEGIQIRESAIGFAATEVAFAPEDKTSPRDSAQSMSRPASIGTLFPDDEHGVSRVVLDDSVDPNSIQGLKSATEDMKLIRDGLRLEAGPPPDRSFSTGVVLTTRGGTKTPRSSTAKPRKPRRRVPLWLWSIVGLGMIGGGVYGGLEVREIRLSSQIREARVQAHESSRPDTYAGHRNAQQLLVRIAEIRHDETALGALARAQAVLVAEFGDSPERATSLLESLQTVDSLDGLAAKAYLAIAAGEHKVASQTAVSITTKYPNAAIGYYLLGRAKLLESNSDAAAEAINRSLEIQPSPLAFVALAQIEALRGDHAKAQKAVDGALSMVSGHPLALIWRARILLLSGDLPTDGDEPDGRLAALSSRSAGSSVEAMALSPAQKSWAGLVLAEIKLYRGDVSAAKRLVAEAKIGPPNDWMFSELLVDVLIGLGEREEARVQAIRNLAAWPQRSRSVVVVAHLRLLDGNPDGALEVIADYEGIEDSGEALAVRGRALLETGRLAEASTDLDKAIALGSDQTAVIARARVDVLRGDTDAAIGRLEPMYDQTADLELTLAYAEVLRRSDKAAEARALLEPLTTGDGPIEAMLELAKLEQSEGKFKAARAMLDGVLERNPQLVEALFGIALLDLDDGRVGEARKQLDKLVDRGTENPLIMTATARTRIMTGDSEAAQPLLDKVGKSTSWLAWQVARERGRLLLHRQSPTKAILELEGAVTLRSSDSESQILLLEANLETRNRKGSARALKGLAKSTDEASVLALGTGIVALGDQRADDAIKSLSAARSAYLDAGASKLELSRVAFWLGRSYEFDGDLKKAREWLDRAAQLNDSHAGAYYWLGQIAFRDGKLEAMVAHYEKSVAIDVGSHPLAWYFLGTHYSGVDKKDDAIRCLSAFLEHYPQESGDVVSEAKTLLEQLK